MALRRAHPGWGPRTILSKLRRELDEPPSRSSIYRCLVRHRLIDPKPRRRRPQDYKRWERSRPMELWQMDVMGGVMLEDGTEAKVITGIDDHSRFCVIAKLVLRATARPVCEALVEALGRHGVPDQILTDNAKVFTGRLARKPATVAFDRICLNNGIRHLLTAPYSPTTTGKIERLHKTMRNELVDGRRFATIEQAQTELDAWVDHYNLEREHQASAMWRRSDASSWWSAPPPRSSILTPRRRRPHRPRTPSDGGWTARGASASSLREELSLQDEAWVHGSTPCGRSCPCRRAPRWTPGSAISTTR